MDKFKQLDSQSLQTNFTSEQRAYFDKLKAELLSLFSGQSYEEILASEDSALLKKISDKLAAMQKFVQDKNVPDDLEVLEVSEVPKPWTREETMAWAERHGFVFPRLLTGSEVFEFTDRHVIYRVSLALPQIIFDTLPECLWVRGSLDLQKSVVDRFPKELRVEGDCRFDELDCADLGETWIVGGDLHMESAKIKKLPQALSVKKDINLNDSTIEELPENFQSAGFLSLNDCRELKELPGGLAVENLSLRHTNLKSLPQDLVVREAIWLDNSRVDLRAQAEDLKARGQIKYIRTY